MVSTAYSLGGSVVVGPLFPPEGGPGVFLPAPDGGLGGGGLVCRGGLVLRGGVGLVGAGGGVQGVVDTATYLGGVVTAGRLVAEIGLISACMERGIEEQNWRNRNV